MRLNYDLIGKPSGNYEVWKANGSTQDIMDAIAFADKKSAPYTQEFAKQFHGWPVKKVAKAIWDYLKTKIQYKEDGLGVQDIKSPGALAHSKIGDCKSFAVFTGSILQNLGIPYKFRYTGYDSNSNYRHVYIIIPQDNGEIIIDAVWKGFNSEKPYSFKKDIQGTMARISYIGSVNNDEDIKIDFGNIDILDMTDGQLDLLLAADAAKDNAKVARAIGDIANAQAFEATHDALLLTLDNSLRGIGSAGIGYISDGSYDPAQIGGLFDWAKKAVQNVGKAVKWTAGKVVDGAKTVAKVVTAPIRLAIKGILEVILPKAAPFFAYAYLPDSALTASGKRKKKKAEKLRKFITDVIGMKEDHFYKIIDRGVHKRLGTSIKDMTEQKRISGVSYLAGVGAVPVAAVAAVVKPSVAKKLVAAGPDILKSLGELLQKIFSVFKKKDEEGVSQNDMPSEEDFTVEEILNESLSAFDSPTFGGGSSGGGGATGSWEQAQTQKASTGKFLPILIALGIGGALLLSNKK